MKRTTGVFLIMIIFISACAAEHIVPRGNDPVQENVRIFDTNFIEQYFDTLNVMFDNEWTLLSEKEIYIEPGTVITGSNMINQWHSFQFFEWVIEYRDANGDTGYFVLYNHTSFLNQILSHISRTITEYYWEHFVTPYLGGFSPERRSFSIRIIDVCCKCSPGEATMMNRYRRSLTTPEGAIRLSQLTPANVFEMVPFYISTWRWLNESTEAAVVHEAVTRVEAMIESMNIYTNRTLNAEIMLGVLRSGDDAHWWSYVQGERVWIRHLTSCSGNTIFNSYIGVFW